jgi:signal transduction histidine kinase
LAEGDGGSVTIDPRGAGLSFRARILLLVLFVSVVPLLLLGLWQARSTARSGEELLRTRLDDVLAQSTSFVTSRWVSLRSGILFLADDPAVQAALLAEPGLISRAAGSDVLGGAVPSSLRTTFNTLDPAVSSATIRRSSGETEWQLSRAESARGGLSGSAALDLRVEIPIHARLDGRVVGLLSVSLDAKTLLPDRSTPAAAAGMVIALLDASGLPLTATAVDPTILQGERFQWGGDEWLAARRAVNEPPVTIVAAAPLGPFTAPFRQAADRATWLLMAVALVGIVVAALLTTRMTRSLQRLSRAAEAVSSGDLDQQVTVGKGREVAQVATAFNSMTRNLRRTLRELSNRESLAAVGEFASTLAHEIRNPLTAVQIDLQFVEDELSPDSPLKEPQAKALAEIRRLDATVSDALRVARSGRIETTLIDLRAPLKAAAAASAPGFDARNAVLELDLPTEPVMVGGDADALEQLFLNLLRNAAEALSDGGRATASVVSSGNSESVVFRDNGQGMSPAVRARVFEPLFSTRREGTGLGLPISRRLATAHGGSIEIESEEEKGTVVTVHLPLPESHDSDPYRARSL